MNDSFCSVCGTLVSHSNTGLCYRHSFEKEAQGAIVHQMLQEMNLKTNSVKSEEPVNHPTHYNTSDIEPIKAIKAWGLGFNLGNVVKYIARAGKKDPNKYLEDLKKARWYLDDYITELEKK